MGCRYIGLRHYVQRGAGVLVSSIMYRGVQVYWFDTLCTEGYRRIGQFHYVQTGAGILV